MSYSQPLTHSLHPLTSIQHSHTPPTHQHSALTHSTHSPAFNTHTTPHSLHPLTTIQHSHTSIQHSHNPSLTPPTHQHSTLTQPLTHSTHSPAFSSPCRPPTNTVLFGSSRGDGHLIELLSESAQGMIWTSLFLMRRLDTLK